MKTDIRCAIIRYINECAYATLGGNGFFGCNYKKFCVGQRPQVPPFTNVKLKMEKPKVKPPHDPK